MKTTCLYCEKEYETKRDSSTYCSNSCRTGAYKYRKRVEQFEAENQKVLQAQKEATDKQKQLDDEKRKENADKRRKAKENKALKEISENVLNTQVIVQKDSVIIEPDIQIVGEQKPLEIPEQKGSSLRPFKEIQNEIESKRREDDNIQNSNLKLASWIIAGGIAYKIIDSIFNPPKNGPSV